MRDGGGGGQEAGACLSEEGGSEKADPDGGSKGLLRTRMLVHAA